MSSKQTTIMLGYGTSKLRMDFSPDRFSPLMPHDSDARCLTDDELRAALNEPVGAPRLDEIVGKNDRVLIVVPDATRVAGVERIAPLIVERLNERGLADSQIEILIGGGIHRAPTTVEIDRILGEQIASRFAVHHHDANDDSSVARLGHTSRGTPVELNRRLLENDHVIALGAITFHYFAGFSGGRKAILPGCASARAIRANHLLSFDREKLQKREGVATGVLKGNAVHEDMEEAVGMLKPSFLVNTIINAQNEISAVYAGDWREAHRRGCAEYNATHAVPIDRRRPVVIVSCGGAPRDANMIQSHKALEHAATALEPGGTMIALAECSQGLGRNDFLDWFVPGGSPATAQKLLQGYQVNGQTAWGLRKKAETFRILMVSSFEDQLVRQMGLEPHASLESALATLNGQPGYIIPNGLTTLPQLMN
ncbi:MAG TPA: nickel-dependent lactate racemase [Pyrinomonadaceae bacterium]|nr:nickel-dependent lactate racemase [Pyrinomonadaceae bacterium]